MTVKKIIICVIRNYKVIYYNYIDNINDIIDCFLLKIYKSTYI